MTGASLTIAEAQEDVRTAFANGSAGSLVSGLIWIASAALGTWGEPWQAILAIFLAGSFIYPLTQLVLRIAGRRGQLAVGNPLRGLAMQVAFMIPLCFPVVVGAALHKINWFFPALSIVVGAHYLPFVFLYGLRHFAALAVILVVAGLGIGLYVPQSFPLGGWVTGTVLILFSAAAWTSQRSPVGESPESAS